MHEILLSGLPADRQVAMLASYALLQLVPGSKLFFKEGGRTYIPLLQSHLQKAEDLAAFLHQKDTWNCFLKKGDFDIMKETKIPQAKFKELMKIDPWFALSMGTDQVLGENDKKGIYVEKTPYLMNSANSHFQAEYIKTLDYVLGHNENDIFQCLTDPMWSYVNAGNPCGFFSERAPGRAFRGPAGTVKSGKSKVESVPVICLMAFASFRLMPCFFDNFDATAPGWRLSHGRKEGKSGALYLPVFTRPFGVKDFMSLMLNPAICNYRKNSAAMKKIGVDAVYRAYRINPNGKGFTINPSTMV